jgi:hypothetical protein
MGWHKPISRTEMKWDAFDNIDANSPALRLQAYNTRTAKDQQTTSVINTLQAHPSRKYRACCKKVTGWHVSIDMRILK